MTPIAKFVSASLAAISVAGPASAQAWPSWADSAFGRRPLYEGERRWAEPQRDPFADERREKQERSDIRSGGARPDIAPVAPPVVAFAYAYPANSIVIDTGARKLYYVLPDSRAYEYAISVGREGFNWNGTEVVSRKQAWPDWYPPAEMRERDSTLPEKMTGGVRNPLGAMALYLGNTLYRIHGTNDVKSIGQAQSSGCFRMLNAAVLHLASVVEIGTTVAVVPSLSEGVGVSAASPSTGQQQEQSQSGPAAGAGEPPVPGRAADYRALRTGFENGR